MRYASLDFWRGAACLMVVCHHSSYYERDFLGDSIESHPLLQIFTYGLLGVPLFFVISGYCIAASVDSCRKKGVGLGEYFRRRYRRIFPPYLAIIALTAVAVAVFQSLGLGLYFTEGPHTIPPVTGLTVPQWVANLTLTESWRYLITPDPREYYLGQSWSLCYEEQFYLIFGIILLVAAQRMFTVAAAISAVVVVTFLGSRAVGVEINGTFLDGRWLMFAAGILVYWILNYATQGERRVCNAGLLLSVLLLAGLLLYPPSRNWISVRLAYIELATATAFAAALTFLHPYDRRLAQSRLLAPVAWCGTISYSIYLVHWSVVKPLSRWLWLQGVTGPAATVLITLPLCVIATLVASHLFFQRVERHFLNSPAKAAAAVPKLTPVG